MRGRGESKFPVGESKFPVGESKFPRGESKFPVGESKFPRGESKFPRAEREFPVGEREFPRGESKFPRGEREFPVGERKFPRGESKFPRGEREFPAGGREFPRAAKGKFWRTRLLDRWRPCCFARHDPGSAGDLACAKQPSRLTSDAPRRAAPLSAGATGGESLLYDPALGIHQFDDPPPRCLCYSRNEQPFVVAGPKPAFGGPRTAVFLSFTIFDLYDDGRGGTARMTIEVN